MNRTRLGQRGEAKAARHVRRHGLRLIARNWRCPEGELDILARDGELLVIIEVRTARTRFAGGPVATVGPEKRRRLTQLAQRWLLASRWKPAGVRFDVVGVVYHGWFRWEIDWVRGAFEV